MTAARSGKHSSVWSLLASTLTLESPLIPQIDLQQAYRCVRHSLQSPELLTS